jgi:PPOX class probable F420-dependent enzyme
MVVTPVSAPDRVGFAGLAGHHYIALTTYRKNGTPVVTPVWFVSDGERLAIWTSVESGKVKRLRHTPRVHLAPSTHGGRVLGRCAAGVAHFVPPERASRWERAFQAKYGWQQRLFALLWKVQHQAHVYIEITPALE